MSFNPLAPGAWKPVGSIISNPKKTLLGVVDTNIDGFDLQYPLDSGGFSSQTVTFSAVATQFQKAAQISFIAAGASATNYVAKQHSLDRLAASFDIGYILHQGNNTNLSYKLAFPGRGSYVCDAVQFSFCAALNVSAYTSGTFNLNSVTIQLLSFIDSAKPTPIGNSAPVTITPDTAFTGLTAAGTLLMPITYTLQQPNVPFLIYQNQPVTMQISTNISTGSGTYQVGFVPLYPLYRVSSTQTQLYYESEFIAHILALPENAAQKVQYSTANIVTSGLTESFP